MNTFTYPAAYKVEQVDNYHGIPVADPYRWLEDDRSKERATWIGAQRAITEAYLSKVPQREVLRRRFEQLLKYPRYYDLVRRGPYLFFLKNDGLQDQLQLYAQQGLDGVPSLLVDPIQLASDGTIRIVAIFPSKGGRYLAYGLSRAGSDGQEYVIRDMATMQDLPHTLTSVKCTAIAWCGDGLYYSRFPMPGGPADARSAPSSYHQVWYHRIGTPQSSDALVYEDAEHPQRIHFVHTTEDERFAVLSVFDSAGTCSGNQVWLLEPGVSKPRSTPIICSFESAFRLIDNEGDKLLVLTNHGAPNWRLILIDPAAPEERSWQEVIPEGTRRLESASPVGGLLLVTYRTYGTHRLSAFDRAGALEKELPLPGIGAVQVFRGQREDPEALWSFLGFTIPPTVYRYDIDGHKSSVYLKPRVTFASDDYETTQDFCVSQDGTQVPVFIVHKKNLPLNGRHPSLLYAYGADGTSVGPTFDPLLIALVERGVIYAVACVRGGGEYGEAWHRAGWRDRKQNSFDDCIAAAEWLQARGFTSSDRAALIGVSNGGLLVGAVMVQRPDLFRVALPCVGIMDMLRFQRFTIGWTWITEYGSSDDPEMFPILLAYSPIHNIKKGVTYPATLVVTSEHDDRVVPSHSFKFAATLQELGAGARPYLIRIDTRSGHGSASLSKAISERADLYTFMFANLPDSASWPP
ncbi:MAG: prolyl oligopeptidase family serine peptidase [Gemmatimonadales bacterium]